MTAITVTYGAKNQHYHDDVVPDTSALMYTRSFDPLYSIFIQLQNTSADMGATGICPGMQYCSMGENVEDICETHGYPFINPKTGYWNGGDALLMNMNSYHRGTAYTKKKSKNNRNNNVEDRVMVILTLGPKPRPIGESRQISQGATMSLRYDMWVRVFIIMLCVCVVFCFVVFFVLFLCAFCLTKNTHVCAHPMVYLSIYPNTISYPYIYNIYSSSFCDSCVSLLHIYMFIFLFLFSPKNDDFI